MLQKPDKVFSTQLKVVDDSYLLQLIEVYPLKDIKKYIKIPSSLYPMLIELDKQFHSEEKEVIRLSLEQAINKLKVGYTPTELDSKYYIPDSKNLEIIHYKLNNQPKLREQVYCSDNKTHELKWVLQRNYKSLADTLAAEIRSIFQSNSNLRQYAY